MSQVAGSFQSTTKSSGGTVTAVTGVAPIASSGGATPAISIAAATSAALGAVKPDGTVITVSAGAITVPDATSAALGVVQPDGTIITVSSGAITVAKATSSAFGVVEVDGTTITASGGVISAVGGGGSGALTKIAQTILAAPAASVTFSGISGAYTNLLLVFCCASSDAALTDSVELQLNSDAGAHYDYTYTTTTGSSVAGGGPVTATTFAYVGEAVGASSVASTATSGEIRIDGYAGVTFNKNVIADSMLNYNGTPGALREAHAYSQWRSTAVVTAIKLFLASGDNFITGSVFTLYGLQ